MRTTTIIALVLNAFLASCAQTASEQIPELPSVVETPPPKQPTHAPNELGFGPLIGRTFAVAQPTAGQYKGSGEFRQNKLVTRERTSNKSVTSRSVIDLQEDGTLTACFAGKKGNRSHVSRYESPDGKDRQYDRSNRWLLGARGTWSVVNGQARLALTEVRQGTCTPDVPQTGFALPFELTCALLVTPGALPDRIMTCRLDKEPGWLAPAGLDLGESDAVGPWTFRFDPRKSIDPKKVNGPWLLLGPGSGLHVVSTDGRRDPGPTLTLSEGAKELVENDWQHRKPSVE